MVKLLILIIFIGLAIIFSGCTGEQAVTSSTPIQTTVSTKAPTTSIIKKRR